MTHIGERDVYVTGIGQSAINRKPGRNPLALAVDACLDAIEDAGLKPQDIDGLSTWPGLRDMGFSPAGVPGMANALNLKLNWYSGGGEGAGQYVSIFNAIGAICAGLATHVLCFRAMGERSVDLNGYGIQNSAVMPRATGSRTGQSPYWALSASTWMALHATLHMERYGITREQMSAIPITLRKHAGLNPKAVYRDPLSLDEYMNSRMISTPLCLYDCDVPVDGTTAVILSHKDAAKDMRHPGIRFEAVGGANHGIHSWEQREDYPNMSLHDAGKALWARTDLKPADVDIAGIYDGFTILTMLYLEGFQFCDIGESGAFIEGGTRISLDGELPLNTNGGQLSEGRMHAYGFIHENILQMRGDAGERQLKKRPEVAVCAAGGGPICGGFLLVKE